MVAALYLATVFSIFSLFSFSNTVAGLAPNGRHRPQMGAIGPTSTD